MPKSFWKQSNFENQSRPQKSPKKTTILHFLEHPQLSHMWMDGMGWLSKVVVDKKTETQKDWKTKRQKDRKTKMSKNQINSKNFKRFLNFQRKIKGGGGGGSRHGEGVGVGNHTFQSVVLDDLWYKKICRPKMAVWSLMLHSSFMILFERLHCVHTGWLVLH